MLFKPLSLLLVEFSHFPIPCLSLVLSHSATLLIALHLILMSRRPLLSRRKFLGLMGALGLSSLFGGVVWADSYRFEVTRHKRKLEHLKKPLKVVQLTDLHFGRWIDEKQVEAWVDATLAEAPDLIVITGDFYDYTVGDTAPLVRQLGRLSAPLGVWGVWGNHDYDLGQDFLDSFEQDLNSVGINILKNSGVKLRDDVYLGGTDDLWGGNINLYWTMVRHQPQQASILLTHIPDTLYSVPYDVDLALCGHTHGGQIKLPFFGAISTASRYGDEFVEGWVNQPLKRAFISRGLGMVLLPFRFLSRAELVVFELEPVA